MRLARLLAAVALLVAMVRSSTATWAGEVPSNPHAASTRPASGNTPEVIQADSRLQVTFGEARRVIPRGLQPSLLCTRSGTLVVQAQLPQKPFPSKRITYPYALTTAVSRDGGATWTSVTREPRDNAFDMEGGALQLRDGTIIALDTYITPGDGADQGVGQLYTSNDDWRTLSGPKDVSFDLPGIEFYGSTDDGGRPHAAQRFHRRIIEMPNGDLLTTVYGWLKGDDAPCTYLPRMKKTRVMLARSTDRGQHWRLVSTVAADPKVGTEGFGEPVICRLSTGPHPGRLICLMRTGRELYQAVSDDQGVTWGRATPLVIAGLDVYRTDLWVDAFRHRKDFHGKDLDENNPDELRGAVVDPDLIELRSGVLVAAFGVRVPQKLCWRYPEFPWNGNYLAFSLDHGQTWSHVIRLTSGILTTHYMAIEETPVDNHLYVTYDLGGWSKGMPRDVFGRAVTVSLSSAATR
jgi:hypothetical protein